MVTLTRDQARELAVAAQGLAKAPARRATKADLLDTVRRLGCVQIDTIHVVARSHYLVLWSRLGQYEPDWLDELLHPDRHVFEYWAHAASLVPTDLLPYFLPRMERTRASYYAHPWTQKNLHVVEAVRRAVLEHGPLGSTHFEAPERDGPVPPWAWYGGKPTNQALDVLWSTGELVVRRRDKFQRIYDLPERVFPDWHTIERPTPEEEQRVLTLRAADAMGIVLPRWLNDYFRTKWGVRGHHGQKPADVLRGLAASGELIPVKVQELGEGYVSSRQACLLDDVLHGAAARRTTLLSPFDNLIWDRKRTMDLFDFDYRFECYTPAHKRIYGYFTLPILDRGRLIGRLEPKADRKNGVLIVRSLHLEPGVRVTKGLTNRLRRSLSEFARFHQAEEIRVESAPDGLAQALSGPR